jgi:hypothetical protein
VSDRLIPLPARFNFMGNPDVNDAPSRKADKLPVASQVFQDYVASRGWGLPHNQPAVDAGNHLVVPSIKEMFSKIPLTQDKQPSLAAGSPSEQRGGLAFDSSLFSAKPLAQEKPLNFAPNSPFDQPAAGYQPEMQTFPGGQSIVPKNRDWRDIGPIFDQPMFNQPMLNQPMFNQLYSFDGIGPANRAGGEQPAAPENASKSKVLDENSRILSSSDKSAREKLKAVEALSNAGINQVKLQDRDGERTYRIEKEDLGNNRSYLHVFAPDDKGVDRVVLRGISDGHGHYQHERNSNGKQATFEGTQWSKHMADRSVFAANSPEHAGDERSDARNRPADQEASRRHRAKRERDQSHGQDQQHEGEGPQPPDRREQRHQDQPRRREQQEGSRSEGGNEQPDTSHKKLTPLDQNRPSDDERNRQRLDDSGFNDARTGERGAVRRNDSDWNKFFQSQNQGNNCVSAAMSMMYTDWDRGAHTHDLNYFNGLAGIRDRSTGYRGSANGMAGALQSAVKGMHTQVMESGNRKEIGDALDRQLDQGHTVIAGIKSPYHAENNHYIYVAGKDNAGNYVIGDPGNHNGGILGQTISREDLLNRIMNRHGGTRLVAGWSDEPSEASHVKGSAAERYAELKQSTPAPPPAPEIDRSKPAVVQKPEVKKPEEVKRNDEVRKQDEARPSSNVPEYTELKLNHNAGGGTDTPDAIVRVSPNFDPSKPIHLVLFNHGWDHSAKGWDQKSEFDKSMEKAGPNTVMVSLEWQKNPGERDSEQGDFAKKGMAHAMLQEVFDKTPGLRGKNVDRDVATIDAIAHSAGDVPTETELADHNLANKFRSITYLDAHYSRGDGRDWIDNNIKDISAGTKWFNDFYIDGKPAKYSKEAAEHARRLLAENGLPSTAMGKSLVFEHTNFRHRDLPKHVGDLLSSFPEAEPSQAVRR